MTHELKVPFAYFRILPDAGAVMLSALEYLDGSYPKSNGWFECSAEHLSRLINFTPEKQWRALDKIRRLDLISFSEGKNSKGVIWVIRVFRDRTAEAAMLIGQEELQP